MEVLIIRPGALGDTLMLLPSLAHLSRRTKVTFVGRRPGLAFVQDFVHQAWDLEAGGWHRLFTEHSDCGDLPITRADVAAVFLKDPQGAIRANLRRRIPETSFHFFSSLPAEARRIHAARHIAECLQRAGLPVDPRESMDPARRKGLLQKGESPRPGKNVVFHPGSGSPKKNHSPLFWEGLMRLLCERPGYTELNPIVLLGPAEERYLSFFQEKAKSFKGTISYWPAEETLVSLLREAALYIGHDSGVTHLAAMLGTPTLAFFKRSDPVIWAPLGPAVRVIDSLEEGRGLLTRALEAAEELHPTFPTEVP
jgi:heptosyltransferase-3